MIRGLFCIQVCRLQIDSFLCKVLPFLKKTLQNQILVPIPFFSPFVFLCQKQKKKKIGERNHQKFGTSET